MYPSRHERGQKACYNVLLTQNVGACVLYKLLNYWKRVTRLFDQTHRNIFFGE